MLALVGLSGVGKSTLAPLVANQLGWDYVDTDAWIEQTTGKAVAEMVETDQSRFRELELEALEAAGAKGKPVVVACGAGLMAQSKAATLLEAAITVWLDAPDPVLLERLGAAESRPLLRENPGLLLAQQRSQRVPAYQQSLVRVEVGEIGLDQAVELIVAAVQPWLTSQNFLKDKFEYY